MTGSQYVGYTLAQTSAVTAIASTRIYHGARPKTTTMPCINYFRLAGRRSRGTESAIYTINCRAVTAETAEALARTVEEAFGGSSGTGIYGTQNSFDCARGCVIARPGLVPEPDEEVYNAPVDIQIVYPSSTVS